MTRAVLPNMIERQIGDIINISSTAGLSGNFDECYSASNLPLWD
jgi:3-oxoacyl-[acyl-carrier protein] reductase